MLKLTEHAPKYPHGVDRVVCTCGFDSGVVPGAFAWPDYGREWADNPVAAAWRQHVADVTYQTLTALGWRFDDGEPTAGRDFDPSPDGHWVGCLCKWCVARNACTQCGHGRKAHSMSGCGDCPRENFTADHLFAERG